MATVLVAEPDPGVRTLLELIVGRLGHRPIVESELADGAKPDLLLLEPVAPRGLALAERLRGRWPRLPILCVSIDPPSDESQRLDPVGHVMKPFRRRELELALEAALAGTPGTLTARP